MNVVKENGPGALDNLVLSPEAQAEVDRKKFEKQLEAGREAVKKVLVLAEAVYLDCCKMDRPELRECAVGILAPLTEVNELLKGLDGQDVPAVLTSAVLGTLKRLKAKAEEAADFGEVRLTDVVTLRQRVLDLGREMFQLYTFIPKPLVPELEYGLKRVSDLRLVLLDQEAHF